MNDCVGSRPNVIVKAVKSSTLVRDVIVGFVLSVSSWYFFHEVLGVILPAGILDGVL